MNRSVPCPHTDDAPLLALGALEADEAAALRAHAAGCDECRSALAAHEALVDQLEGAIARTPAPSFDDLALAPLPAPEVLRPRRRRRTAWAGSAAGLAVAAAAALVFLLGGGSSPAAVAAVRSELPGAMTTGQARLFHPDRPDGELELHLHDVPTLAPGTYYAVWVLPRGQQTMEAVGTFAPRGHSVDLKLPLPGSGDYRAVDVSIQRVGGPSAHSNRSLAGGPFRSQ
jgi:Anti-sigma-K factor rskA